MAKKSKWKGAALSLLGSIPFVGKVKKGVKAAKKSAKTLQKKAQTTKIKVKAVLKKGKNKVKKKKKKIKKKTGKVFTKARKLKNNLTKKDLLKKLKKGMKKTVLAAKSVKKKAVKYVKSGRFLDDVQLGLDVIGMIPVAGTVAGVVNAGISAGRGNFAGAALDLVSCIPGVGTVTKGGKLGVKAVKAIKAGEELATTPKKLVNSPATNSKTINRLITNAPTLKSGKSAQSTGKGISGNSQLKFEPKLPDNLFDKDKVINKLEIPWGPSNIVKVVKIEKGANLGKSIKKSINSGKDKPKGTVKSKWWHPGYVDNLSSSQILLGVKQSGKGLSTLGSATRSDALSAGKAWVGKGAKEITENGQIIGYSSKERAFRLQYKQKEGMWRANFQENSFFNTVGGQKRVEIKNVHIDILD